MTFNANIPMAGDIPSQSQRQILANFTALNTVFAVDHLAFNAINGGKHNQSTYLTGGAPGNLAGEGTVYVDNPGGTRQYAYFQRESSGVSIPFSMIGGFATFTGGAGTAIAGTSFNFNAPVYAGVGIYNLTLTNAMIAANYVVSVTINQADAGSVFCATANITAANTLTVKIKTLADVFVNPTSFSVIVFGEIA